MERVSKLALLCSKIDDYLKSYHRAYLPQLREADVEIYNRALGWTPKVLSKTGKSESVGKELSIITGILLKQLTWDNGSLQLCPDSEGISIESK